MQPIKITAKMLTSESLVEIVDQVILAGMLPHKILLGFYKRGLATQLQSIKRQLEGIAKKAKNKKLPRKEYVALARKERQLCALGNKKLDILKSLENATD